MDSNLLKVFISVANSKSISQAAKELEFTQSNVTLRIKQLEKNLGYELFHRTNRGVVLSLEGEKFYPYAVDIVKKVEEATLQMRNINYQELLKVGSSQTNATIRMLSFTKMLNNDFKDMKLEFTIDSTVNLLEMVLDYKIDIAFIVGKPNNKDIEILNSFENELYLLESKDKKIQKNLLAYRKNCVFCTVLEKYAKENFNEKYKTLTFENYELILGCVKAGFGITVLPRGIVEKFGYFDELKLTKFYGDLNTYLICRKNYKPMIESYLRQIKL